MTPALTPGEWANICVEGECRADDVWYRVRDWHPDPDERANDFDTPEPNYHAIAALCLYNQPFGFTHEDVEVLRQAVEASQGITYQEELESLRVRISALLPPQTP